MDIAKIRKKAKEQGAGKRPEDAAVPPAPAFNEQPENEKSTASLPQEEPADTKPVVAEAPAAPEPQPADDQQTAEDEQLELLTFSLGAEEFAFKVSEVEEILRFQRITVVPTMPGYVSGITSLRGKIIPVLDLRARLNLEKTGGRIPEADSEDRQIGPDSKILIIEGPKGFIGAMIDRVMGVVRIGKNSVLEPPAHLSEAEMKYIEGIVILDKRFISVLRSGDTMNIEI